MSTVAKLKEVAAAEFEAWQHEPNEWLPPDNEGWSELMQSHIVAVRIAWAVMYKPKPELVNMFEELDDKVAEELCKSIGGTADTFQAFADTLRSAECRLLSAAAVVAIHDAAGAEG